MLENNALSKNKRAEYKYRTPDDLMVSTSAVKRFLVVGSCMAAGMYSWAHKILVGAEVDHVLYNFPGDVVDTPRPLGEYDFQLIHLPLRTVVPEVMLADLSHENEDAFIEKFKECEQRLLITLDGALAISNGAKITTFISEFLTPQQNLMGRMLPRYDLRNPTYFVEQLNRSLHAFAAARGAYVIATDAIAATFGRKFVQEDIVWSWSHASYANDWDSHQDTKRIEQPTRLTELYPYNIEDFILAFWCEVDAMYRTIVQQDSVKLVIIDLDDTLWRGVVAEEGLHNRFVLEGWPLGMIEALKSLKQRGILLGIASKNDEATILELWPQFLKGRLGLEEFAVRKINWRSKVENIQEILNETNLLPKNVVFIDDNPVERESVRAAYPSIRVLGDELYSIRRILLWAPELQVAYITQESQRRTEMIQAQVQRDASKAQMSREEFLASLNVRVGMHPVTSVDDQRFPRALELINKSNQFNTTGRRWTLDECHQAFGRGAVFNTFEVEDIYSSYGLVGIAIVEDNVIEQFVMSCRVIGLGVEQAVIAKLATIYGNIKGIYVETEANKLCRDLYQKCSFEFDGAKWILGANSAPVPSHVSYLQ